MVYSKIFPIIENNIRELSEAWYDEVMRSEYMKTYQSLGHNELVERGSVLYSNLFNWLITGYSDEDVEQYFEKIGAERLAEGFPLSEINYALYLEKKVLWRFLTARSDMKVSLMSSDIIDFFTRLNNYFDIGDFFIIRGYLSNLFSQLDESEKFSKEELKNYFSKGALYGESIKKIHKGMYGDGLNIGILR